MNHHAASTGLLARPRHSSMKRLTGLVLVAGVGCGGTLIDEHARSEMLVLSCAPGLLACNGACLSCSTPDHAKPACAVSGCGFTCDAGYNQCSASSCVAESATSCGSSCEDCSGKAPDDAVAICNGQHRCDFECQPGFLRSGNRCQRAMAVSAGFEHTCAITADGRVKCWGSNEFGQLGDGTVVSSAIPVDAALPGPADRVAAGYYHTCAVVAGRVYCWGNGTLGELGDGKRTSSATPVLVPGLSGVDGISAGGDGDPNFTNVYAHTCAIVEKSAWCWGSNGSGQLGDSSTMTRSTPVRVTILPAGTEVASISIGERHTCALTEAGAVYCWGANDSGQLGLAGQAGQSYPAQATVASGATAVATGEAHSCAVVNQTVVCWGLNSTFQVDPAATTEAHPEALEPETAPVRPTLVSAGRYHTCALDATAASSRQVCCFGANDAAQLGAEDPQAREVDLSLAYAARPFQLSAGAEHTCVLTVGGGVQCWGGNDDGQLGNGTAGGASATPAYVSGR